MLRDSKTSELKQAPQNRSFSLQTLIFKSNLVRIAVNCKCQCYDLRKETSIHTSQNLKYTFIHNFRMMVHLPLLLLFRSCQLTCLMAAKLIPVN